MAKHILKCTQCGIYTMKQVCKCGGKAIKNVPAKFSPEDKMGEYRRRVKKGILEKEGLL